MTVNNIQLWLICWQRLAALTQVLQGAMPQTTDVDEAEVDQFPTTDVSCIQGSHGSLNVLEYLFLANFLQCIDHSYDNTYVVL